MYQAEARALLIIRAVSEWVQHSHWTSLHTKDQMILVFPPLIKGLGWVLGDQNNCVPLGSALLFRCFLEQQFNSMMDVEKCIGFKVFKDAAGFY